MRVACIAVILALAVCPASPMLTAQQLPVGPIPADCNRACLEGLINQYLDAAGRLWSERLGAALGLWEGEFQGLRALCVRLFDRNGKLQPTATEAKYSRAEAEHIRAETEKARAEAAEIEAAKFREELKRLKGDE